MEIIILIVLICFCFSRFETKTTKDETHKSSSDNKDTSSKYTYVNHCWKCKQEVNNSMRRCGNCGWYICKNCGKCGCGYHYY